MSSRSGEIRLKGFFLLLEGIEGAGKTTHARRLAAHFTEAGYRARYTREPGDGIPTARDLLMSLDPNDPHIAELELALFIADRRAHYRMIRKWLSAGEMVICDRGPISTIAYQVYARGLDMDWVCAENERATGGLKPDLAFLFDGDPEKLIGRKSNAPAEERNRFDDEAMAFHRRVREGFLMEQARGDYTWSYVSTIPSEDEVFAYVCGVVWERAQEYRIARK